MARSFTGSRSDRINAVQLLICTSHGVSGRPVQKLRSLVSACPGFSSVRAAPASVTSVAASAATIKAVPMTLNASAGRRRMNVLRANRAKAACRREHCAAKRRIGAVHAPAFA
jgi:hypothetical protein